MINGLCLEGLFDEAVVFMSKMEDNGSIHNAITYQTIIHALFENDENDKTKKLLRYMIAGDLP
jgi:pentatricopeptide repeat domain-containing protein 1